MPSLPDVNLWLALALFEHVHQPIARQWFDLTAEPTSVFFCRATEHAFLRLLTTTSVVAPYGYPPLTNSRAWSIYHAFLSDDRVDFRGEEPAGLEAQWQAFSSRNSASPKLWMDAYLAAFAFINGWKVVTTDRAFTQFPDLDVVVLG